jgi:hypothetical protein
MPTTANPAPQQGNGAFGLVPGATSVPDNLYQQVNGLVPGLGNMTGTDATNITQLLEGIVPTDVQNQIQNTSAQWGVSSGMPGSGLQRNGALANLGLTSLQEQQTGANEYLQFLTGVGSTQTDPSLAASISENNAVLGSAPNPESAYNTMMTNLYDPSQFMTPEENMMNSLQQQVGMQSLMSDLNPARGGVSVSGALGPHGAGVTPGTITRTGAGSSYGYSAAGILPYTLLNQQGYDVGGGGGGINDTWNYGTNIQPTATAGADGLPSDAEADAWFYGGDNS